MIGSTVKSLRKFSAVNKALPGRIASVADAVGHAVGARLFSSFGIPLLVGGGVLLGLFLLLRNCDPHEAE
jgi:hypothetical protein